MISIADSTTCPELINKRNASRYLSVHSFCLSYSLSQLQLLYQVTKSSAKTKLPSRSMISRFYIRAFIGVNAIINVVIRYNYYVLHEAFYFILKNRACKAGSIFSFHFLSLFTFVLCHFSLLLPMAITSDGVETV